MKSNEITAKGNRMKKLISIIVLSCFLMLLCSGCKNIKIEEAEREQLDYTVLQQDEVPETIKELIEQRKVKEFQLTYKSGEDLYLFKGYGQQMMQELIREHGHKNLRLYVESHNHRAIHIYEKFGFQYVKNYGDSDTVRIMIRKATVQPTPVAV